MFSVEWDMSELGVRRGRCTGILDLLIYNIRNEELATRDCKSFQRFRSCSEIQVNKYIR